MEQMEWREGVMEARTGGDHHGLEHLHQRLRQELHIHYDELAQILDDHKDFVAATEQVRRLMFLEKLLMDIQDALASFENGELDI